MERTVDYYCSLASPYAYMGDARFTDMARRLGVTVRHKPVDFSRIFPASGGLPLAQRAPQRQVYRLMELKRWRAFLDLPLNLHPKYFPVAEWPAAGMVIAARQKGLDCAALTHAILKAVWTEERDIADGATLSAIAGEIGIDGDALLAAAGSPGVKQAYDADTAEAITRGVFGAPTYVYGDELFWGQDRLEFLEQALLRG